MQRCFPELEWCLRTFWIWDEATVVMEEMDLMEMTTERKNGMLSLTGRFDHDSVTQTS